MDSLAAADLSRWLLYIIGIQLLSKLDLIEKFHTPSSKLPFYLNVKNDAVRQSNAWVSC